MSATQSFVLLTTGFFLKFEFERHTLATSALPWPITHPPGHVVLYVLGALFMVSFFSKTIESRQFKKWLVGADSPLEFARQTIRLNGDVTNRSQAAHVIDRLDVANNTVIGLKFWARKRDREIELSRARKRARTQAHEEDLELMALGYDLPEPSSFSFAGLNATYETHMAFHFFEKAWLNLRRPRLQRDGLVHPLRFDVTINHYDEAGSCHSYSSCVSPALPYGVELLLACLPDGFQQPDLQDELHSVRVRTCPQPFQ